VVRDVDACNTGHFVLAKLGLQLSALGFQLSAKPLRCPVVYVLTAHS
jgi:hypothetical protein